MRISLRHQSSVAVDDPANRIVGHLLLTPQSNDAQTVEEWKLDVPDTANTTGLIDAYGNQAHLLQQTKSETELVIVASGIIETFDRTGVLGRPARDPVVSLFLRQTELTKPIGAVISKFRSAPKSGNDRIPLYHGIMDRVFEVLRGSDQDQSQTQQDQSQSQSQSVGAAPVAADFAHAFIGAARALELPARFVSGYLVGVGDEPSTVHSWAEAWDDRLGWIGFDASLAECPTDRHVRLASGLDAISAATLRTVPVWSTDPVETVLVELV